MPNSHLIEDKRLIEHEDDWPAWPVLPLKRYVKGKNMPESGLLLAGLGTVIHMVNMWSSTLNTDLEDCERKVYESVLDLLKDGWEVD